MRILLDESVPQKLRLLVDTRHTVVATWFRRLVRLEEMGSCSRRPRKVDLTCSSHRTRNSLTSRTLPPDESRSWC